MSGAFADGSVDQVGNTKDLNKRANWMREIQTRDHWGKKRDREAYEIPSFKMDDWNKPLSDLNSDIPGQSSSFNNASRPADNENDVPRSLGTELGLALMAGAAAAVAAGELAAVPWIAGAGAFFVLSDSDDHEDVPNQELDEVA